jgi:hypothetical protein
VQVRKFAIIWLWQLKSTAKAASQTQTLPAPLVHPIACASNTFKNANNANNADNTNNVKNATTSIHAPYSTIMPCKPHKYCLPAFE